MDGLPVIDFALNAINIGNDTQHYGQHPGYVGGWSGVIVGKHFNTADQAYRLRVGINTLNTKTTTFFDDPLDTAEEPAEIENSTAIASSSVVLGVGLEKRRGHNRLQGAYGAEALITLSSSRTRNVYGVEWNQATEDFGQITEPAGTYTLTDGFSRILSSTSGLGIGVGARAFAGVEYFFAPKISIGAEFGWSFGLSLSGRGTTTTEVYEAGATTEEETQGNTRVRAFGFGVDTGGSQVTPQGLLEGGSGAVTINFHI